MGGVKLRERVSKLPMGKPKQILLGRLGYQSIRPCFLSVCSKTSALYGVMILSRSEAPLIDGTMTGGTTQRAEVSLYPGTAVAVAPALISLDIPLETALLSRNCCKQFVVLPDAVSRLSVGQSRLRALRGSVSALSADEADEYGGRQSA